MTLASPLDLLRPPRWRIPAMFNHLHHGGAGHLLHNAAGHLVNACAAATDCPSNCGSCDAVYTLTISGLGSPGVACCIPDINGTFTLSRIGGTCQWSTGIMFGPGGCSFGWQMFCSPVDCNDVAGPMRWVVQLYGAITFVWAEAVSSSACPPVGTYAICANPCSGGTGASVVVSA
jgi:hypothetical protein